MFFPSHLYTGSGSDQKVPAPTGSGSATLSGTLIPAPASIPGCGGSGTSKNINPHYNRQSFRLE